jgi:hypothetical protein
MIATMIEVLDIRDGERCCYRPSALISASVP